MPSIEHGKRSQERQQTLESGGAGMAGRDGNDGNGSRDGGHDLSKESFGESLREHREGALEQVGAEQRAERDSGKAANAENPSRGSLQDN